MRKQMYDADIAQEYGIIPAVMLDAIRRWIEHNAANGVNIHDGKVWAFSSVEAWAKQFPEFSKDQVRRALDKLRSDDLLEIGSFNKVSFDRKLWYTLTPKAMDLLYGEVGPLGKFAKCIIAKLPNENWQNCQMRFGTDAKPIESSNKYTNKDILPTSNKSGEKTKQAKAFMPPTVDEVREYIASHGYNVDADHFVAYYEANNWRDAKNQPVKNWKQRLISWVGRGNTRTQPIQPSQPIATVEKKVLEATKELSFEEEMEEWNNNA